MFHYRPLSPKATFGLLVGLGLTLFGAAPAGAAVAAHNAAALPAGLRPAMYRALAKDAGPAYAINKKGCAATVGRSLKACFDSRGAHISGTDTSSLALRLLAFGRGEKQHSVSSVAPQTSGNRVSYQYGPVSEWWRVLPVGFEQGFTVTRRLQGQGKLKFVLAENLKGSPQDGALAFGKLRYGGLVVTDAKGTVMPSTLNMRGHRIVIAVNDAHAVYPLTVDPMVWLEQKVVANDGAAGDLFGGAVAVDGTTAVIGAEDVTVGGNAKQGAAYIFNESNGTWSQTAKLTASDGVAGNNFGFSVGISGQTIAVGAPYEQSGEGAAYVFKDSGGSWTQTAKLTASDANYNDNLGWSVAISGDTVAAGAVGVHELQGAVYVFANSGGNWSQTAKLTASDGAPFDDFGYSVAAANGTILVGASGYPGNGQYMGAAYVFNNSGGNWTQTAELTPSDAAPGDFFGLAVSLDSSGSTALIGAYYKNLGQGYRQGAAYVFDDSSGAWTQTAELTRNGGVPGDYFGEAVAINDDGTIAFVGAPYASTNGVSQGVVDVFMDSGGTWSQTQEITASDGVKGNIFGLGLNFSGNTALVGSPQFSNNGNGAAYFYGRANLGLSVSAPNLAHPGSTYVSQAIATNSASAASPAVAVTVALPTSASFISANATQGSCSQDSGVVTCNFGQIPGNAGVATANVKLKVVGNAGDTIHNTASVLAATPALTSSAATPITANSAPVASDGTLTTKQNTAASGTLMASDPDGDSLTYSIVDQPSHGTVSIDDASSGAYTYTPNKGFSGKDSFTFKANDGLVDSNTATVSVTVKSTGGGGGASAPLGLGLLALLGLVALVRRRR